MVYATLAYRVLITNRGNRQVGPIGIAVDMTSAHGSRDIRSQLAPDDSSCTRRDAIETLPPGETATLSGRLQMPLAEILPVRMGSAECFVPLVRFMVEIAGEEPALHVFTAGLRADDRPDAPLLGLRIDRGFAHYKPLGQREIDVAHWLALDGESVAR